MRPEDTYLSGIRQRMESVEIGADVAGRSTNDYPERIREMFTDDVPVAANMKSLIMQVVLIIEDASLGRKMSCSMQEIISEFRKCEYAKVLNAKGCNIDPEVICPYIVADILQNGGVLPTYKAYDDVSSDFRSYDYRLIDEVNGEYSLTSTALDFLFRQKEIDEVYDYNYLVAQALVSMRSGNYEKAFSESMELLRSIRRMRVRLRNWEIKFRENIVQAKAKEFSEHCNALFDTFEKNRDKLKDLEKLLKTEEQRLRELFYERSDEALKKETSSKLEYLHGIQENILNIYSEQSSLLTYHQGISANYAQRMEESLSLITYDHLSFRKDIFEPLCAAKDGVERMFEMIFAPLLVPHIPYVYTPEDLFDAQTIVERTEEEESAGLVLGDAEQVQYNALQLEADRRNREIITDIMSYAEKHGSFIFSDYIKTVSTQKLSDWRTDNAIYNIVLQLYQIGSIDVHALFTDLWVGTLSEPGEYDIMKYLHEELDEETEIYRMIVSASEKTVCVCRETDQGYQINDVITDFRFDVERRESD